MDSIDELKAQLARAHATNQALHRRVQQAEAGNPGLRSRGRAKLAADCVRMQTSLGKIRAIAAGWGGRAMPLPDIQAQALRDIAEEAASALTPGAGA